MKQEELRLSDVLKAILEGKKIIIISLAVALVLAIINFATTPKEYITKSTLLPVVEQSSRLPGNLGGLAGLAGLNMPTNPGSSIPPNLYPDVVASTPFGLYLIKQEFYFPSVGQTLTLEEYFVRHQEVSLLQTIFKLPGRFFSLFKKSEPKKDAVESTEQVQEKKANRKLSGRENSAISQIRSRVSAEVDMSLGIVTVQVKIQDPQVASKLVDLTYEYLSEYVINYKSSADIRNLEFIEERYDEAKRQYFKSQDDLASFRDRNRNIISAAAQVKEEQLRNEVSIYFNVFNNLAQEVEQAKIRVQRSVPVFNVLEPAYEPLKESSPKLVLNIVVFLFLGFALSVAYILFFKPIKE
ncbi:hypothetical protein [Mongoliibacter ruber]|uniref:Subunit length determinant protein n=1 Tax=Mongoliibacter ruber TaxID=1750599 RepID=A0A2T0WNY5_9BACT|nr:hypothetical protein [Mongoliibacter ruber]PRY88413.1 hypothetical protein CLW00_10464 [Mongoliibacter ruber]